MYPTLHIVMWDGGGGTVGPTKRSNSNTIIYPSPLWFYREPDVKDMGTYYEVNCFSENNFRWNDKSGALNEVKKVTFVDTKGNSHDVMFLGLDDYFCYKKEGDGYIRTTGSPSGVEGAVKTVGDINISGNKASYWAKPITLILTIPHGYLDALCVRQACWDKIEGRGDPTGEQWEDWAERFSDIPLTYSNDIAKNDPHVFGPPGGPYSAGRQEASGEGYYYMNGIVYNMQKYTKHNVFHIILPAQCIVEWIPKPKPPYFYNGFFTNNTGALPNTLSELRQIIKDGKYDDIKIQRVLIPSSYEMRFEEENKSVAITRENYEFPDYLWEHKNDDLNALVDAGYRGINTSTLDFSDDWVNGGTVVDKTLSALQLSYSSDIGYCLLDAGSSVCYPTNSDKSNWVQGWVTSITPQDKVFFSTTATTSYKNEVGVSFYPIGEDKIRVYDYYLSHSIINSKYRNSYTNHPLKPPCPLYYKGMAMEINSQNNYTYNVTLSEPNFRLGFVDEKIANERMGATFNKDSAPWAAKNVVQKFNQGKAGILRRQWEGYFVLKDNPSLQVSYLSNDYNSYKYYVKVTNNDLFPALYYIERDGSSVVSTTLDAGASYDTTVSIPREQNYSSPRDINHTISTYSREGGKEQSASQTVQVSNVPRNTMTYRSYYNKGTITVTRTSHFGSGTNETLSSGSYVWQNDVLHISITNIPSGYSFSKWSTYSFSKWSTGSTSTDFYYTVGTSSVHFEAQLTRTLYTFAYTLGTGRYINRLWYRSLSTSGSYGGWTSFTGSKILYKDDQVHYSIPYSSYYASNSSGSAATETGTITMSSNVSKSFTAAYMKCYFGKGEGATDVVIKVDGTQVTNDAWRWITNTTHSRLYYSCYFRSSNTDWDGNRAYAFNPLYMGNARSSSATGNDGWGDTNQHPSENGLYTVYRNKYSTGYVTRIPAGSGGNHYYCTSARYYAYFRFKLTISLSMYSDWFDWGNKKALYNVYNYCQTYDWSKMSSKDWHNNKNHYNGTTMSTSTNLTLQGGNTFTLNNSSNRKWNSTLGFYYYESNGSDGGVGDVCLNGNPTLYYRNDSNLSEGVHRNVGSSGSYSGYGKCNGKATIYAYQSTFANHNTNCYKVARNIYDNDGPPGYGTFYICEMHPYKSNGCKTWYTEPIN